VRSSAFLNLIGGLASVSDVSKEGRFYSRLVSLVNGLVGLLVVVVLTVALWSLLILAGSLVR